VTEASGEEQPCGEGTPAADVVMMALIIRGWWCKQGVGWVAEDGWDGCDAGVDEAFDAGLGVVEGLELAVAVIAGGIQERPLEIIRKLAEGDDEPRRSNLNPLSILYLGRGDKNTTPTAYLLHLTDLLATQIPPLSTYSYWANKSWQLFFSLPRRSVSLRARVRRRRSPRPQRLYQRKHRPELRTRWRQLLLRQASHRP
jgi:hypothetical protein